MKKYVPLLLLVLLMLGIFGFSSQKSAETNSVSYRFCEAAVRIFYKNYSGYEPEIQEILCYGLNSFIRKAAHFSLYAAMGFSGYLWLCRRPHGAAATLCGIAAYAALDELHQFFVEGRTGRISDVFLDTCGAAFGILVCFLTLCTAYCLKNKQITERGVWKIK